MTNFNPVRALLPAVIASHILAGCGMSMPSFTAPALQEQAEAKPAPSRVAAYSRSALGNTKTEPAPQIGNGKGQFIEVQQGETLLDISRRTKVPVSLIMSENKLSSLTVLAGQKLFIPKL